LRAVLGPRAGRRQPPGFPPAHPVPSRSRISRGPDAPPPTTVTGHGLKTDGDEQIAGSGPGQRGPHVGGPGAATKQRPQDPNPDQRCGPSGGSHGGFRQRHRGGGEHSRPAFSGVVKRPPSRCCSNWRLPPARGRCLEVARRAVGGPAQVLRVKQRLWYGVGPWVSIPLGSTCDNPIWCSTSCPRLVESYQVVFR